MSEERFEKHGVWEAVVKADAPPGRALAVRGVISSERRDLQDEVVVQAGLDLAKLADFGWINDNHSKRPGDEFGQVTRTYPTSIPGEDGEPVPATGIEGFFFDTPANRELHAKAVALRKSGSRVGYGFSIEGQVLARDPKDRRRITKARISQVALTRTPVNRDTLLEAMAKSLDASDPPESNDGAEHTSTTTGTIAPTVPQDLAGTRSMKMKDYLAKRAKGGCAEARGHLEDMAKGGDAEAQALLDDLGVVKGVPPDLVEALRKSLDDLWQHIPQEGEEPQSLLDKLPDEIAKALPMLPPALQAMQAQVNALAEALDRRMGHMVPAVLGIGEAVFRMAEGSGDATANAALAKSLQDLQTDATANAALLKSVLQHLKAPAPPAGAFSREQLQAMGRAQGTQPVQKSVGGAPPKANRDDLRKSLQERRDATEAGSNEWHSITKALKALAIGEVEPAERLMARAG